MSQPDSMDSQDAEELLAVARLNNQAATQATVSTTATAQRRPANGAERTEQAKMKMGRNNTEGNTENSSETATTLHRKGQAPAGEENTGKCADMPALSAHIHRAGTLTLFCLWMHMDV